MAEEVETRVPFAQNLRENVAKTMPKFPDAAGLSAFASLSDAAKFHEFQAKAQDKIVKGAITGMIITRMTSTGKYDKATTDKVGELLGEPVSDLFAKYKDDIPRDPSIELLEKISGQLNDLNKNISSLAESQKALADAQVKAAQVAVEAQAKSAGGGTAK